MLYLRQKCNLCGHVLEYKEMPFFFFFCNLCSLGSLYNQYYKMEAKCSIFLQGPLFLACLTGLFGDKSPGFILETLK